MATPNFVIIDVDTGVDDAWALAMLVKAEQTQAVRILAVTTVAGNTGLENATRNTVRVLETLQRTDIPVYKGARESLILNPPSNDSEYHGLDGFGDVEHQKEPNLSIVKEEIAASAIHRYVLQHPKQVTLLCCGPLTNVALALQLYPDFAENIKHVYIMGGNYQGIGNSDAAPSAEFNFYTDPESAHIVLNTLKCPMTMLVWECAVVENLNLEVSWRFDVLGAVDHPFVHLMNPAEHNLTIAKGFTQWYVTDALMVAAFLFPDQVIKSQELLDCTVELHGWLSRGQVAVNYRPTKVPNVNVIQLVSLEAAKEALLWTVHPNWLSLREAEANANDIQSKTNIHK